jgi:DNA-binding NtrC family response regulator
MSVLPLKIYDREIDLALLDTKLTDMEGGGIYPLIMEIRPNLKVIVCSGYSIDGPAQAILDGGALEFIQKPFTLDKLSEKLRAVWEIGKYNPGGYDANKKNV